MEPELLGEESPLSASMHAAFPWIQISEWINKLTTHTE